MNTFVNLYMLLRYIICYQSQTPNGIIPFHTMWTMWDVSTIPTIVWTEDLASGHQFPESSSYRGRSIAPGQVLKMALQRTFDSIF